MKKLLSSLMAIAMVGSMSAVSFASDRAAIMVNEDSRLYREKDGILYETKENAVIKPGEKIYIEILSSNYNEVSKDTAAQYKAVTSWTNGSEVFQKAGIENKKVSEKTGELTLAKGEKAPYDLKDSYASMNELIEAVNAVTKHIETCKLLNCDDPDHIRPLNDAEKAEVIKKYTETMTYEYKYFAAVYTKSSNNMKLVDLVGDVKLVRKNQSSNTDAESKRISVAVGYGVAEVTGHSHDMDNNMPILDFSNAEGEVEINFDDFASFEVNVDNQKNVYMEYNTDPDTAILDQNPNADIDFLNFTKNPEFSRVGVMRIYSDDELFIYENTNAGLKEIRTKYDEDYAAYTFNTRKLSSYVISSKELKYSETAKPETPDTQPSKPSKPVPDTGAGMGNEIASAMLLISMAGAAAVIAKKVK